MEIFLNVALALALVAFFLLAITLLFLIVADTYFDIRRKQNRPCARCGYRKDGE